MATTRNPTTTTAPFLGTDERALGKDFDLAERKPANLGPDDVNEARSLARTEHALTMALSDPMVASTTAGAVPCPHVTYADLKAIEPRAAAVATVPDTDRSDEVLIPEIDLPPVIVGAPGMSAGTLAVACVGVAVDRLVGVGLTVVGFLSRLLSFEINLMVSWAASEALDREALPSADLVAVADYAASFVSAVLLASAAYECDFPRASLDCGEAFPLAYTTTVAANPVALVGAELPVARASSFVPQGVSSSASR